jgi:glycosidase
MKSRIYFLLAAVFLFSCSDDKRAEVKHSNLILGLGSPVTLPVESPAEINLDDFVLEKERLDSVTVSKPFVVSLSDSEESLVQLTWSEKIPPISELKLWADGIASSIFLLRSKKEEVELTYSGEAESVQVAGEFTSWSTKGQDFEKNGETWTKTLFLDPGMYQYQIVVDGTWMLDPANPDSVDNNVGGFNSLLNVGNLDEGGAPLILTSKSDKANIRFEFKNEPTEIFAVWENHRLPADMVGVQGNELTVALPILAQQAPNSTIRVWSYNEKGVSNDVYIPLQNGKPIQNAEDVKRTEWHSAQMYFMMVDRFVNGNKGNDAPVNDPEIDFKANYQGGDLAGIHQTLDEGYFEELSMNTVWVSPITQNPEIGYVEFPAPHRKFSGYHGYWPVLNTVVDHRLGTSDELRSLIDDVHDKDMNIILDFVSNHVHEDHPIVKEHPEWRTQLDLPDGTKNIRIWEDQRLTTWFDTFLPSLDHSIPEVTDMLSDTALFWVTEYGFDGFRHDAAKHIPQDFWRTLTRKIKQQVVLDQGKPVFQLGETFGSRELIGSYIGSGMMDGKFDFNLYFDARNVFALDSEDFKRLGTSLQSTLSYYGHHHLMGNITGNHDLPRFICYAGDALQFGEDEKEAGWNRDIKVENPVGYKKLEQLIAFMWTIPGIPVMYYGDEFGMPGAGDPDNRRLMRFELSENEKETLETTKAITALRKNHLALQFGDIYDICADGKMMHYRRKYFDDEVIVIFNKDSAKHMLPVHDDSEEWTAEFGSRLHYANGNLEVQVPAYGFEILTRK